jgi:hypothetical protein
MTMTVELLPPATSLPFRANLAQLVSPLRRVRSRTPFFQLPAHRIPTLWSLYRGLLKNSPSEDVHSPIFHHSWVAEFDIQGVGYVPYTEVVQEAQGAYRDRFDKNVSFKRV